MVQLGKQIQNTIFYPCDLENAPIDLKVHRLCLWPVAYYGTLYQPNMSFPIERKCRRQSDTLTDTQGGGGTNHSKVACFAKGNYNKGRNYLKSNACLPFYPQLGQTAACHLGRMCVSAADRKGAFLQEQLYRMIALQE